MDLSSTENRFLRKLVEDTRRVHVNDERSAEEILSEDGIRADSLDRYRNGAEAVRELEEKGLVEREKRENSDLLRGDTVNAPDTFLVFDRELLRDLETGTVK
ncbi:MAG: hypothetical protein ABEK01_00025 [Candidatus Nanohaloarchaea archaeon]